MASKSRAERFVRKLADQAIDAVELKYGAGTLSPDGKVNVTRLWDWANYMRGAVAATLALTGGSPFGHPRLLSLSGKGEEKVYDEATVKLMLSSYHAMSEVLSCPQNVRFTDHQRDKKGTLIKCRAYIASKRTIYEEVEP